LFEARAFENKEAHETKEAAIRIFETVRQLTLYVFLYFAISD